MSRAGQALIAALAAILTLVLGAPSATAEPSRWTARWIAVPGYPARAYGVYHFRRAFTLAERPTSFRVHVTADNRYRLYVNGRPVARGPARGDLENWRYESLDLAPHLRRGRNVLAAVVWNFAEHGPLAQMSDRTGFLLQGETEREQKLVDTGPAWRGRRNDAYEPIPHGAEDIKYFYVAGPGERVRGDLFPWGWETLDHDDSGWRSAVEVALAAPRHGAGTRAAWILVPRSIPMMEERPERLRKLRRATGVSAPARFPSAAVPLRIPPRTRAELLLDQTYLTTAYPELVVSGGKGSRVTLSYAENLWGPKDEKGHRDEIEGKIFRGTRDEFLPDGGARRLFGPLWWRTYRYVQLTVETADEPLTVDDLRGVYTGYPFQRRARFQTGAPELDRMLEVGWRTARLCAHETYMDCPYYEQLQYIGDTRVQALVSLYMSGDDRLMRNAIAQFNDSRIVDETTKSRWPSSLPQYIPTFSLLWIGMLHDHWWYRDDPAFVRAMLPGVRAVLAYVERRRRDDAGGVVGRLPYWAFVDWVDAWPGGVPPGWSLPPPWSDKVEQTPLGDPGGASSIVDLHLLLAYRWAADLERALGDPAAADRHVREAARLGETVRRLYWDPDRKLFADTAGRRSFSQHASVLAVLADVVTGPEATALVERVLADPALTQASIYFRYYVHEAMRRAGLGDRYLEQLGPWRRMLARGLTTWAETEDPTRSECHAWGASPNIEFFRTVLGVDSAAPGFRKVRVAPALGRLTRASGVVPHPNGDIAVDLALSAGRLSAEVRLPPGVTGEIVWRGHTRPLVTGTTRVTLGDPRAAGAPSRPAP